MANRVVLIALLLSLLWLCGSGFDCTFYTVRDVLVQICVVRQVGTYTIPRDVPPVRNESTWRSIVGIVGDQEGITRRIQIYDDNMNVGICSGNTTLSYEYIKIGFRLRMRSNLQLCGREKPESFLLHSNSSAMNLPMSVDSKVNLTVEDVFVNGKPVLGNKVELPVNSTWETFTFIKYTKVFPSFLNFTYILKSENSRKIEISVLDLDMDRYNTSTHCEDDYIYIIDAHTKHRWCQGHHGLTSQGSILYITLRSDTHGWARDFEVRYREPPILPPASTTLAPTWSTDAGWSSATVNATERPQILTNRRDLIFNYFHVDYNWTVQTSTKLTSRIKVTFTNVDLGEEMNCSQANITLYKGTIDDRNELDVLCGRVTPGVSFSWLSPLTIRLQTHGVAPAHFQGFVLEYQSTAADEVDSCNTTVYINSNATYLTFASRGRGPADSVECWWKPQAPSGSRVSLQSEDLNLPGPGPRGCSDWLQVYNGLSPNAAPLSEKVCGSTSVSVTSTGQTMRVRFHTDGSNAFFNLRLRVTAVSRGFCRKNGYTALTVSDGAVIQATKAPDDSSGSKFASYPCSWRLYANNFKDALQLNYSSYLVGSSRNCNSGSLKVQNCGGRSDENLPLTACLSEQGYVTTQTYCIELTLIWSRSSDVQGFRAEVWTKRRTPTTNSSNFIVIVSPISAGTFMFIVGVAVYWCDRRRKRSRRPWLSGNDGARQATQASNVSLHGRRREPDQGGPAQSSSASVAACVLSSSALSEPPSPYPDPMLETTLSDPPPSYASVEGGRGTSPRKDDSPPAYSEVQFAD